MEFSFLNTCATQSCVNELGQNFFISVIYKPSYCKLPESRENLIFKIIFLFYPPTLNIICFVEKNIINF